VRVPGAKLMTMREVGARSGQGVSCPRPSLCRQGDDAKREIPKACVVLKPGGKATAEDLDAYCRQNLAAYVGYQIVV